MNPKENIEKITDLLERLSCLPDNPHFLNKKHNGKWISVSTQNFLEQVHNLASSLIKEGLQPGNKIALISSNKPEWMITDFACQISGLMLVPLFPSVSEKDFKYIVHHAECCAIFFGDEKLYKKYTSALSELPELKKIYLLEKNDHSLSPVSLEQLIAEGSKTLTETKSRIEEILKNIQPHSLAYILYTSGTSGDPKGVMLSEGNIASNIMACRWVVDFKPEWKALSFLPLNHVYEHTVNLVYFYHNISIYYLEHLEAIGETAREIHPDIFVAVPRIFDRVYDRILKAGEQLKGLKRKIFDAALRHADQFKGEGCHSWLYECKRKIFDTLVYSKWRAAVGGNIKYLISGGAALNPKMERVFSCAGIPILQGYGLTETSPIISVNLPGKSKFGTVGPVITGCQIKIAPEDGEILMKGPGLMLGYYKNEKATREAIDEEGWFHTGDVGTWVDKDFLKITDRKKEIFKTSAGKYIAPAAIENKLKECPFIENCMVIGEYQKFASALILPDMKRFEEYCKEQNKKADKTLLEKLIQEHITKVNTTLADFEKLRRCRIVEGTWSIDGGELTPKLSLKRRVILEKYKNVIQEIYHAE